jgi:hypothetical protein
MKNDNFYEEKCNFYFFKKTPIKIRTKKKKTLLLHTLLFFYFFFLIFKKTKIKQKKLDLYRPSILIN